MIQGLLFNRIDTEAAGSAIGRQDNLAVAVFPYKAQACLAFMQFAGTRAKVTHDAVVIQSMPVPRRGDIRHPAFDGAVVDFLVYGLTP